MSILTNEPVIIGFLIEIITILGTKFGLKLDSNTVAGIATALAAVLAVIVRHFVTPTAKASTPIQPIQPVPPPTPGP